jgi:DNA uptake protein ComE-like DNA-binding protein
LATKLKKASIAIRQKASRDMSPRWDGAEDWSGEQFTSHFRRAMEYYRMETSVKDLKVKIVEWMQLNGWDKTEINTLRKIKDKYFGGTVCGVAACLVKGMPAVHEGFNQGRDTAVWMQNEINKILNAGSTDTDDEEVTDTKPAVPVINIQDRVREAAYKMTEEIETAIEDFQTDPENFDPKAFKVLNLLKGKDAKAAHARIIKGFYQKNLDELLELASGEADDQLKEGYKHRSKKQIKNLIAFLQEVSSACDMLAQEAKVNRKPRKVKAVSKDKIVAKLKYKKTDESLKLVSINPADIIGAKELWVYNTKSRKLGKYVATEYQELGVKGASIVNFSEANSICKTLRKPEEKLKEFKSAGKVQLRKFLDDINATDTKMNGRINEEIILLKVL